MYSLPLIQFALGVWHIPGAAFIPVAFAAWAAVAIRQGLGLERQSASLAARRSFSPAAARMGAEASPGSDFGRPEPER